MGNGKETKSYKTVSLAARSLVSALIGSSCILGPMLFAGAGTAGLMAALSAGSSAVIPYEPFFWLLALGGTLAGLVQLRRSRCREGWRWWLWGTSSFGVFVLGIFWIIAVT